MAKIENGVSPIVLSYYEDPNRGLFGDKIETDVDKAIETIKIMLDTLSPDTVKINKNGEKEIVKNVINFITDNPGSELAIAINNLSKSEKYKDRIKTVTAGAS
jgi:hypothetical protein